MTNMIVVDVETGGLIAGTNPLLSIGAVDYQTGDEFYGECRRNTLVGGRVLDDMALAVNGFTIKQTDDPGKPNQIELYQLFVQWAASRSNLLAGQQVGSFDIPFLHVAAGSKAAFETVFSRRSVDLHSIAFAQHGQSFSLDGILKAVGLEPEPKPHNALTGARLERDAFKRLLGAPGWKS